MALIITGGISPNADGVVTDEGAKLTTDEEAAWHKVVTDAVHQDGAKICMGTRLAPLCHDAPTSCPFCHTSPHQSCQTACTEFERSQTNRERLHTLRTIGATSWEYDGVEVMGSEGYLIQSIRQKRTSNAMTNTAAAENRHRFAQEIVTGIRRVWQRFHHHSLVGIGFGRRWLNVGRQPRTDCPH